MITKKIKKGRALKASQAIKKKKKGPDVDIE